MLSSCVVQKDSLWFELAVKGEEEEEEEEDQALIQEMEEFNVRT